MTSTFKLTRAEFKKIFKRPSIFIMAILLVITLLVSITIFNPATLVDTTIIYDGIETSSEYYSYFYTDVNIDSKRSFDEVYDSTDNVIDYYKAQNNNTNLLTNYYNDVVEQMQSMDDNLNSDIKGNIRTRLATNLKYFLDAYKNLDTVKNFTDITSTTLEGVQYKGETTTDTYYTSTACKALSDFYAIVLDTKNYTEYSVVNAYKENGYKESLKQVLDNGVNYVYTTIKGLCTEYNGFYATYLKTTGMQSLNTLKNCRENMLTIATTLDNYLEKLIDYPYPIVIIDKETYLDLNQKLDEAIIYLSLNSVDDNNINKHESLKESLDATKISTALSNLSKDKTSSKTSTITQIHISQTLVSEFEEIKSKVAENKTIILDKIDSLKADESINNISKSVTEYSLLSECYNDIILDKVLLNIADEYDSSTYTAFYGYDFDEFNKYQYRERISANNYYIDNNTYSNSYITNFSYSQNSGNKTNVYDFMYFTLELCSVIIIVFAMMLVCNLITGETESGTIKLLLVRPYKRSKIITAKLFATIFFVLTFVAFTSIVAFIGGYFLYGTTSTPVLSVLNSSTVFEIHPFLLMLVNILSHALDIIFFVLLALMISILFKNFAASISASIVLLIINYSFNILFGGAFWYTLLPGMNLHMFKYFGNAFTSIIAGTGTLPGIFQSVLVTGIHTSMSLPYSIFIYLAYSVVFLAVSYSVFQKRDF